MTVTEALKFMLDNPNTVVYSELNKYRWSQEFLRFEVTRSGRNIWRPAVSFVEGDYSAEPVTQLTNEQLLEAIGILSENLKAEDLSHPLVIKAVSKVRAASALVRRS